MLFKQMLNEEAVIPSEMTAKLNSGSAARRLDLIYEWVKTDKLNKKQFVSAINTFIIGDAK